MSVSSKCPIPGVQVRFAKPEFELSEVAIICAPPRKALSGIVSKRLLHRDWRRPMTKLPNNKHPNGDKSEQSRDIVEKAGEIGADEDRSSVYDLMVVCYRSLDGFARSSPP
jgi:hypothetical protein